MDMPKPLSSSRHPTPAKPEIKQGVGDIVDQGELTGGSEIHSDPGAASGVGQLEPAEFAQLFKKSFRVLWWIAAGIVSDRAMAEDIVQEAAVLGLSKLDQFRVGSDFTAWVGQMVKFIALNHARKRQRRHTVSIDGSELDRFISQPSWLGSKDPTVTARGELSTDQPHFDDRTTQALDSLDPTARACLLLRTLEGMGYADISRILEIPQGTAMSHVHRTRRTLRERLADMVSGG